jgi:hypothetical protein
MADSLVSQLNNISSLGNGDQFIVTDDSDSDKVKNITYSALKTNINNNLVLSGYGKYPDDIPLFFGSENDVKIVYDGDENWLYCNFRINDSLGIIFQDRGTDKIVLEDSGIFRPATDGEGSIGQDDYKWATGYFENLTVKKGTGNSITLATSVNNGNDSTLVFLKSRGGTTESQISNNDSLGEILWKGYSNSDYQSAAYLKVQAGTISGSDLNARMIFGITGANASNIPDNVLIIEQDLVQVNKDLLVNGDINSTSDITLKENIKPLENSLEKVKQLRGVEYDRIDTKSHQIGVIAQEVEKIYPDFVSEGEDGIKSVSYGQMVSVLIEAIKDLSEEVDHLKSIINN